MRGLYIYGNRKFGYSAHFPETDDYEKFDCKPCPFCGCKDVRVANTHSPAYIVRCSDCGASVYASAPGWHGGMITSKRECLILHKQAATAAIKKWNTRT